jgi:hypothetical protein
MEIITRPNPLFAPTTAPENKPMVAPPIADLFVAGDQSNPTNGKNAK